MDLQAVHKIDRVHVYTYHDGQRYYQYDVETSTDGKTWSEVADMRTNTRLSSPDGDNYRFDPIDAGYVRVQMTFISDNPSVIVYYMT